MNLWLFLNANKMQLATLEAGQFTAAVRNCSESELPTLEVCRAVEEEKSTRRGEGADSLSIAE